MTRANAYNRILDAAEQLVSERGVRDLTLEAVAAKAGLSKGGLLYHFASKEQLVVGMVQRIADELSADIERAMEAEPPGPGRMSRAMLHHFDPTGSDPLAEKYARASAVLLATMVQDPELLDPMRRLYGETFQRLREDGLPPGRAEVIGAALDGLWFGSMFGLHELDPEQLSGIRADLEQLAVGEGQRGVTSVTRGE